jgi:hypothetical protein
MGRHDKGPQADRLEGCLVEAGILGGAEVAVARGKATASSFLVWVQIRLGGIVHGAFLAFAPAVRSPGG